VTGEQLQEIYELMKWGPTWSNTLPLRIVYVTTPDGKARLLPHLQPGNVGKATQAPVNAILAVDSAFHHQFPRLFPFRAGIRDALETDPGLRDKIGTGGAWMQAAYFIVAVRAAGLAAGPMGGFDTAGLDAEFFPSGDWRSFLIVNIGYSGRSPGTNACRGWTMRKRSGMPNPRTGSARAWMDALGGAPEVAGVATMRAATAGCKLM
jgi:3-hydroxypropanoate dehydrogenase